MRPPVGALAVLAALAGLVPASGAGAQPKPRPFDRVTGIVFTCAPATGFAWTAQACDGLTADFRKRAAADRLPFVVVPITADFSRRNFGTMNGFNADKAVRVFWYFKKSSSTKGRIFASLSSNFVWEPTPKDIPNVVPGQRIPMNFYMQEAQFEPGITLSQAQKALGTVTGVFFDYGEGKL